MICIPDGTSLGVLLSMRFDLGPPVSASNRDHGDIEERYFSVPF